MDSKNFRKEFDTFGEIQVPNDKLWGAQTQRSLQNFEIGSIDDKMPLAVIRAMAIVKKSAAKVNITYGLKEDVGNAIINAANEVIEGKYDSHFPLVIFQTGSGTQTNMNVNEVLSNRGSQLLGGEIGEKSLIHPNDHVNKSQSSNDTYPTAMHVATAIEMNSTLLPALNKLKTALEAKVTKFEKIIKIGRTHTQDATPLTLGQEFSGYLQQVNNHINHVEYNFKYVLKLAQGGTAVGTGLNTKEGFDRNIAATIAKETGLPFETAENKFEALAAHDAIAHLSGSLNSLATALYKIGNDVKLLSAELHELKLTNDKSDCLEACEELMMASIQTMGNHSAVTVGNMQGHFELNVFKPLLVANVLNSMSTLSNAMNSFSGLLANLDSNDEEIQKLMNRSLMLVTALNPYIGYSKAAQIAKHAHKNNMNLRETCIHLGFLTGEEFDQYVKPENMIAPSKI